MQNELLWLSVALLLSVAVSASEEHPLVPSDDMTISPLTCHDEKTGITYYVESDGRHVSAIAPDGTVLWHRNPFVDSGMKPYRYTKPVIIRIGHAQFRPSVKGLAISGEMVDKPGPVQYIEGKLSLVFNSSQFGLLDTKTGTFQFRGQD